MKAKTLPPPDSETTLAAARWLSGRREHSPRRWASSDLRRLRELVGRQPLPEICARLGRPRNAVVCKLIDLGYSIREEATLPLGCSGRELSRRTGISYNVVMGAVRSGKLKAAPANGRDWLITWAEAQRYEQRSARRSAARTRALRRIGRRRTITRAQFETLLGISTTQAHRYLIGGVVKAWKVPSPDDNSAASYEWRVSLKDARRLKRKRAAGPLRPSRRKAYRDRQQTANAHVAALRTARRAGVSGYEHLRSATRPGWLTVPEIARHAGLSEQSVYTHLQTGRLRGERVGRQWQAAPDAVEAYLAWARQPQSAKCGPEDPCRSDRQAVHRAGLLTLAEAAQIYGVRRGQLASAYQRGCLSARHFGRLLAVRRSEVRRWLRSSQPASANAA